MPESYDTAMRQPAPNQSTSERLWYLPHFAVTHPQKKKVRLVFDAAARTNGKCLNDALLTGPDLIRSLLGTRPIQTGRVRSVRPTSRKCSCGSKSEEDRDSLRFLWRNNMNENPNDVTDFRRRLIALYCDLHQNRNASEFELEYPEACKAIRLDHYVDDFLKSFNSIEEARRVSKQVYEIHRKAAFELRGWASNEIEVLNEMPDTRNDDNVQLGATHELKTLGLQWDINNDALGFNLGLRNTPTGIDWDETIEADAHKKWLKWVNDVKKLASIDAYRPAATPRGLHVFVDASEKSYAAAVYWRIKLSEHESAVSLIAGKLASLPKVISIPRLELKAALLSAQLSYEET
ncbi:hypothetical protein EVAR_98498_1 [Eumeta japonica]|uniref:Uncharacterized protein n=1 Tax=Eumeta variegata TaxID=151549 RepID=A0A4C2AE21_EUMVA|nr:hypothetical protein EVAR_98498_1 [Eumeta japonica]